MTTSSRTFTRVSNPMGTHLTSRRLAGEATESTDWSRMLAEGYDFAKMVGIFAIISAAIIGFRLWMVYS